MFGINGFHFGVTGFHFGAWGGCSTLLFLVQVWAPSANFAMSLICSLVFGSRGAQGWVGAAGTWCGAEQVLVLTVHASRKRTPPIQRQLGGGGSGMLVKAECQQEVEAAHPAPAWGRWKRNASRKRKRGLCRPIVTWMIFLPLRCRLIILLRCRLTRTRLLLLRCRRIMTRTSRGRLTSPCGLASSRRSTSR